MQDRIRRNDPCPCGSGKKYKRCCLPKAAVTGLEAARFHRLDAALAERLWPLIETVLKKAARDRAMPAFWPRRGKRLLEGAEANLFGHWLFFDWAPEDRLWRAAAREQAGKTVADALLAAGDPALGEDEREAAEALLRTPSGFHEILEVSPGKGLRTREVFLGLELEVEERSASEQLHRGDILYGKVVPWRSTFVLAGVGDVAIPPAHKGVLLDQRAALREECGTLLPLHLRVFQDQLRMVYLDVRERLFNPPRPRMANTDGDPITFHRLRYEIDSPHDAAVALAGLHSTATSTQEALEECRRNSGGRIVSGEIAWTRSGDPMGLAEGGTVLGRLVIDGRRLTVEVNSKRRAGRIRREIERRLGERARHRGTVVEDLDVALDRDAARPPTEAALARERETQELNEHPEVQALLRRRLEQYYRQWLDQPVPALRGRTPREAVRDPDGREMVEALLIDIERGQAADVGVDLAALRKELGLPRP